MTTAAPGPVPGIPAVHVHGSRPAPALDAERLDVYRVALEAQAQAVLLVPKDRRVLRDQLERASLSAVLNIAKAPDGVRGRTSGGITPSRGGVRWNRPPSLT